MLDQRADHGVLHPKRLPATFRRFPACENLRDLVQWWWLAEWDLPDGTTSPQRILPFPSSNLTVEDGDVVLTGPTTGASVRELRGRGWVVGALLQPAAVAALTPSPGALRDSQTTLEALDLGSEVAAARGASDVAAVDVVGAWLRDVAGTPSDDALLANRLLALTGGDPELRTVGDLAAALHVSVRTLHRLAARYIGLTPYALIRRRRLQEAAHQLRTGDSVIAEVAIAAGFADHAHFAKEFKATFGETPDQYRRHA